MCIHIYVYIHSCTYCIHIFPCITIYSQIYLYIHGDCSVCFGVVQCFTVWYGVLQCGTVCNCVVQCVAMCRNVLQCVAVCCGVLQYVVVNTCCSKHTSRMEGNAVRVDGFSLRDGFGQEVEQKKSGIRCRYHRHIATHIRKLQLTATHCNSLQLTATHCNSLPHTVIHWRQREESDASNLPCVCGCICERARESKKEQDSMPHQFFVMRVCIHVCIYLRLSICVYVRTYVSIYACSTNAWMYTCMYDCTYVCRQVCTHVFMYVCMRVLMCL